MNKIPEVPGGAGYDPNKFIMPVLKSYLAKGDRDEEVRFPTLEEQRDADLEACEAAVEQAKRKTAREFITLIESLEYVDDFGSHQIELGFWEPYQSLKAKYEKTE